MNRFRQVVAVVLPALLISALLPTAALCSPPAPEHDVASKAVNAFAIDFYKQVRGGQDNLFFSPYSISMALGMAYAGARGATATQMAKTMSLSLDQPGATKALGALNKEILATGQKNSVELNVANALWAEKSYQLLEEYLEAIRADYQGEIRQLDFARNPEPARKTINEWVEAQTKDKIKDLLPPGAVDNATRLVLTNAIYFKGKWKSPFDNELTLERPFTLTDGGQISAFMMSGTGSFGYAQDGDLELLEMPYDNGDLSIIILLPSKEKRLDEFEDSVTPDKLGQWFGRLQVKRVHVYVPKFKMTSQFRLRSTLETLGMIDAFSPGKADFSGMTGPKDFYIGEGFHKAFVEVNEEGTEAAAATALVTKWTGTGMVTPVFRADHPFLFLIRHKPTNCILFFGRVTNPSN